MSTNKTIAKNTMFLYFRMFLTMGVGLYTSRLVLQNLGVEDYGIYALVGGVVALMSFLNVTLTSVAQRFLSMEIKDEVRLKKTFSTIININIIIIVLLLVLAETIGVWFLNYKLNISSNRMGAANWLYQFSVFTFLLSIIQSTYVSLIISKEKMGAFAYIGLVETLLKLAMVLLLGFLSGDKLIIYAFLIFLSAVITLLVYKIYCNRYFKESKYMVYFDKSYLQELLNFTGWNLFGSFAGVLRVQGTNVLINLFFGTIVNAAYGIAVLVQGIIGSFVWNFQTAITPQITKSFADGDFQRTKMLMYQASKFSFYCLLILVVPIMVNIDFFLKIWLGKDVPAHTNIFIILTLVYFLIETISISLNNGIVTSGRVKIYQIYISLLLLLNIPVVWVIFKNDFPPHFIYYSFIMISFISLLLRLFFIRLIFSFKMLDFVWHILAKIGLVSIVYVLIVKYIDFLYPVNQSLVLLFGYTILYVLIGSLIVFFIGLASKERKYILTFLSNKIKKVDG